jgi:hypothetical protein
MNINVAALSALLLASAFPQVPAYAQAPPPGGPLFKFRSQG